MKHKLLILLFSLIFSISAMSQDFTYNGVNYTVISTVDKTCRTKSGTGFAGLITTPGNNISGKLNLSETVVFNNENYKVTEIGSYSFKDNTEITGELIIPETVTSIGQAAFYRCTGFTGSLTIPDNVQTIGDNAFRYCSGFTGSLTIGNNVQTIGGYAFSNCSGFIGSLTIPESVTSIGSYAFYLCSGFTGSLTIPEGVTSIGGYAFAYCSGFTDVKSLSEKPPIAENNAFRSLYNKTLYVPGKALSLYKGAVEWEQFYSVKPFPIEATGIKLNRSTLTLLVGQEETLIPTLSPEDATTEIIWSTGNDNIVSVDQSGKVIALSIGNTVITAKAGNLTATCEVTVNPIVATSIEVSPEDVTLLLGTSTTLTTKIYPEDATNQHITWTSNNPEIATVASDGTVTGISEGGATITATCGPASATCRVTVLPVEATSIELSLQNVTLLIGSTTTLTAKVYPENTTNQQITWSSSAPTIASIDANGTITANLVGEATITATCGSASATCKVTVLPIEASSIELSLQNVTLLIGSTTTLTAKVYPENTTNQQITWTSNAPTIASVDATGTITAIKEGEATITATCGSASASCKVTVTPVAPTSIELNVKDMVLYIGQSETIQAVVRPSNTTYPAISWQSDDETVATVSANGKVTGLREGTANITARCGDVSASCKVTVNPIPASNIEITTGNVILTLGSSTRLAAKVSPDNTTHPEVDWSSSDNGIATIAADGTVTAVSLGTAIITARCGNVSATCSVTVIPVPSEGIVISPSELTMLLEETFTLSATVYPENTTDKSVTWGSDNPAVASVSSTGVVTAIGLGTANITARNGNFSATCRVTVKPVVATGISLNVKDETIFVASSTQLVATISPANVTDKTISWTSSRPEIATVSDQGEVVGISVGTTTVTASIGSVSALCQINVVHRIPDMDPSVSTSDRDIVTISGRPVNMAVFAEGGEPAGWSYLWTKNGETVSTSSELNITAKNNTNTVKAETYRVMVENEIDKVVILSETFDFVVQIYPAVQEASDGGDGIDVWISTGTDSPDKTREGNIITLTAEAPAGGYPNGWEFIWSNEQGEIGEGESVETVATMSAGTSMAVEPTSYTLALTNYGPRGDVWAQFNVESNPIAVYRRPQTPQQLLRKGDGTSHTFVTMMALSDKELQQLNYEFIYGWTDASDNNHIIEHTDERYCHTEAEIYNDPTNRFWVYAIWVYNDGSMVSSGLRYLDGSADEDFDASVFDGSFAGRVKKSQVRTAIYTVDGHYMGTDITRLVPGIYIHVSTNHGMVKTEKIIIR